MALFTSKTSKINLNVALAEKGTALRVKQANDAESSAALADLSRQAAHDSTTAAKHAEAVEQAVAILDAAGVTL